MLLFGTLHVGQSSFYPLAPRIAQALAAASTLALEIDPAQPRAALQRAVRSHGMLVAGEDDYGAMPSAQKRRLDALILQGGLDAGTVLDYKPVLLATLLALAEYTKQGYRGDWSSEAWLARTARAADVLELESLSAQLSLLDRLSVPDRWRFLDEMMGAIESGALRSDARAMVQAWSTADRTALDAIAARCEADRSVSGQFVNAVLLKERNQKLADQLVRLLEAEQKTVAAVGILHLLGTGSVPALLQERGISVERIY
ncbi:MAG: TraB/GumN family protein [Oxalobacteraceae bacterium]|nr:MAG: TraB/GumN family protein [Oxalobacteraceae bacterium]